MIGTTISGILVQLRDIYTTCTPYAGAARMLLHIINGKFTMGKLNNFYCHKILFLTGFQFLF